MTCKQRLIYDIGVNNANYPTRIREPDHSARYTNGKYKQKLIWSCPFYRTWKNMIQRCYSATYHKDLPNYIGCTVSEEWLLFSNFRAWMVEQNWEGNHLDKDLRVRGNKVYSENTCFFVSPQVNTFLLECDRSRGDWPIGVSWKKESGKFVAQCNNPFTCKRENLGLFTCPQQAHKAWLSKKLEHAYALAAIQTDPRVAKALIERYENYVPDVAVKEKVT